VGTFFLTFVEAGGAMIGALAPSAVTSASRAAAGGLTVMAMIYMIGAISGAHINPAVTLAFAIRGVFPWRLVPLYWVAEFAGAILAALLLRAVVGDIEQLGTPVPTHVGGAFGMETVLTLLLISVILGTATHHSVVGPNAAMAVGGTVAACGLFSRPISGAVMNPARALGPAFVSGSANGTWVYLAGPMLGALLAAGLAWLLHGARNVAELEAAKGKHHA
jgi:aquaporin Z